MRVGLLHRWMDVCMGLMGLRCDIKFDGSDWSVKEDFDSEKTPITFNGGRKQQENERISVAFQKPHISTPFGWVG